MSAESVHGKARRYWWFVALFVALLATGSIVGGAATIIE